MTALYQTVTENADSYLRIYESAKAWTGHHGVSWRFQGTSPYSVGFTACWCRKDGVADDLHAIFALQATADLLGETPGWSDRRVRTFLYGGEVSYTNPCLGWRLVRTSSTDYWSWASRMTEMAGAIRDAYLGEGLACERPELPRTEALLQAGSRPGLQLYLLTTEASYVRVQFHYPG